MRLYFQKVVKTCSNYFGNAHKIRVIKREFEKISQYSIKDLNYLLVKIQAKYENQKMISPIIIIFTWLISSSVWVYIFFRLYVSTQFYQIMKKLVTDFSPEKYYALASNILLIFGIVLLLFALICTIITTSEYKKQIMIRELIKLRIDSENK